MNKHKSDLIEQLSLLKAGYIAVLNELDVMENWGRKQLEALYETKIGRHKVKSLELQIELKAIKKKIQLCHQYINRGTEPDFDAIEVQVLIMLATAQDEINTAKAKVNYGIQVLSNLASPEDSFELRKIYRNIAKSLHPDVNPNISDSQKELWYMFKDAYEKGDLDKLRSMQIVYADELIKSDSRQNELSEGEIQLQIATLKLGIIELEARKKELNGQFPFDIAELIRDDEWVEEQQNLILKEIKSLEEMLAKRTKEYEFIKQAYE